MPKKCHRRIRVQTILIPVINTSHNSLLGCFGGKVNNNNVLFTTHGAVLQIRQILAICGKLEVGVGDIFASRDSYLIAWS